MGSPRQLLRLKRLGLPASALLHAGVLAALILGFRDLPVPPPERPIQVTLVPATQLARPRPTPTRPIELHKPKDVRPSDTPPLVTQAAEAPPAKASAATLDDLRLAPFAEPDRVGKALRARARCNGSSLPKSAAEWNDCPPSPERPKEDEPHYLGIAKEKQSEFDRAVKTKEAWKKYRESTNPDAYPGLRCMLGRTC
jgi:hypothetical protein